MTLYDKIIQSCDRPEGLSLQDICATLDKKVTTMSTMVCDLVKRGRLYRMGSPRFMRYFAIEADAIAWEPTAKANYAAMIERARIANNDRRNAKRRKNRPVGRPVKVKEPKPVKLAAPKAAAYKPTPIVITQVRAKVETKPVTVFWPDTVKVQEIPTPPPRFAFQPEPGWRGQISQDWMDRRLSGATE